MFGLQSQPVDRAMRRLWHRVGAWENRVLQDLIAFTAPAGNYRKIRDKISALAVQRWAAPTPAMSTTKDGHAALENRKTSCIPFIRKLVLSLRRH